LAPWRISVVESVLASSGDIKPFFSAASKNRADLGGHLRQVSHGSNARNKAIPLQPSSVSSPLPGLTPTLWRIISVFVN
jgi:hypothetical protein